MYSDCGSEQVKCSFSYKLNIDKVIQSEIYLSTICRISKNFIKCLEDYEPCSNSSVSLKTVKDLEELLCVDTSGNYNFEFDKEK